MRARTRAVKAGGVISFHDLALQRDFSKDAVFSEVEKMVKNRSPLIPLQQSSSTPVGNKLMKNRGNVGKCLISMRVVYRPIHKFRQSLA